MTNDHLRALAVVLLSLLCAALIGFLYLSIWPSAEIGSEEAGWMTAAFLAIREFISKIENIVLGSKPIMGNQDEGQGQ